MKTIRLFLIITISFLPVCLAAKQIRPEIAKQVAEAQVRSRLQLRSDQTPELNLVYVETAGNVAINGTTRVNNGTQDDVLYYVFNLGSTGFVIVSGDDVATPVLGYSFEGAYYPDNLPQIYLKTKKPKSNGMHIYLIMLLH